MNTNIKIKIILLIGFYTLFFWGCKTRPKLEIENVSFSEEVSQPQIVVLKPKNVFDTLAFIKRIQENPREIGRYWAASRYSLKDDDLDYIPPSELRLIRNEIFARYGYRFNDPALRAHFEKQDWYKPLFDNVEEFITPLERANIGFIQEKERTNPNISYEEQFQFFLESYFIGKWINPQIPEMLRHKFYLSAFDDNFGLPHNYSEQLPPTNNYIYLIHSVFGGCSACTYHHSIYQFNRKGELIETLYLGESDDYYPYVEEKSSNRYEIWFTFYPGMRYDVDDPSVTDEMWEEAAATPIDTIRVQFHYNRDGQLILAE